MLKCTSEYVVRKGLKGGLISKVKMPASGRVEFFSDQRYDVGVSAKEKRVPIDAFAIRTI